MRSCTHQKFHLGGQTSDWETCLLSPLRTAPWAKPLDSHTREGPLRTHTKRIISLRKMCVYYREIVTYLLWQLLDIRWNRNRKRSETNPAFYSYLYIIFVWNTRNNYAVEPCMASQQWRCVYACVCACVCETVFIVREPDGWFRVYAEQLRLATDADDGGWRRAVACANGALQGYNCRRQTSQQERSGFHSPRRARDDRGQSRMA